MSNETINTTIGNITIIISNDDTDDTFNALNSVDIIIIVIDPTNLGNNQVTYTGASSSVSSECNIQTGGNNTGYISTMKYLLQLYPI